MRLFVLGLGQNMNSAWCVHTREEISHNLHLKLISADKQYGSPENLITDCLNTEISPTSDMILDWVILATKQSVWPIVKFIPFSVSRSEGDGCTFSLITAIITQWWYNKLSNNYPFLPFLSLSLPPTQSHQKYFTAQIYACHLFQLIRKNYKHIVHYSAHQQIN